MAETKVSGVYLEVPVKIPSAFIAVAAMMLLPSLSYAQTAAPGSWVRVVVTADSGKAPVRPAVGRLLALDDGVLVLDRGAGIDSIPRARITRLDVRTTRSVGGNVLHGAGMGALIGGAAGLIAGAALHDEYSCYDGGFCVSAGAGALSGAVVGAVLGSVVGLMSGTGEHWQRGRTSAGITVSPSRHGGLLVGISMRR